jgi:hypothetical protein
MSRDTGGGAAHASGSGADGNGDVCPRCGAERPGGAELPAGWLATPPGSTVLPTLAMVRKAAGGDGERCACGRRRLGDLPG